MKNCRLRGLLYNNKIILFDEAQILNLLWRVRFLAVQKLSDLITFDYITERPLESDWKRFYFFRT